MRPDYHGKMLGDGMQSADTEAELEKEYMYSISKLKIEAPEIIERVNEIIDSQDCLRTNGLSIPELQPLPGRMPECVGSRHSCQQTRVFFCPKIFLSCRKVICANSWMHWIDRLSYL